MNAPEPILHVAARLAWLAPSARSLVTLANLPADPWPDLRTDPAAVLLLVRSSGTDCWFDDPAPLERALELLGSPGKLDWSQGVPRYLVSTCLCLASSAEILAVRTGLARPVQAWCAGLLAPLGWLALAAVAPQQVAGYLANPAQRLPIDPAQITHRLARHWELPAWLAGVITHLALPLDRARNLGVEPGLFRITRLAAELARRQGHDLKLVSSHGLADDERAVGISLDALEQSLPVQDLTPPVWEDPARQALMPDLLRLAIENRRKTRTPRLASLESEIDALHACMREQVHAEAGRLQEGKLVALAELAAGAGHEINNPLAVISGEAQYILGHADWLTGEAQKGGRKALETIIQQTRRIHTILRELMLFARPSPARPVLFDLPTLVGEVSFSLEELARAKRLSIEICCQVDRLAVHADLDQVRQALACLVRNAIEAAPVEGWLKLTVPNPGAGSCAEVLVEDSGPGPNAEIRPHLFDPFFSGRSAGRGKGLGLPVAWRLARQQGGEVRLDPFRGGEPTRFVLALPLEQRAAEESSLRKVA